MNFSFDIMVFIFAFLSLTTGVYVLKAYSGKLDRLSYIVVSLSTSTIIAYILLQTDWVIHGHGEQIGEIKDIAWEFHDIILLSTLALFHFLVVRETNERLGKKTKRWYDSFRLFNKRK